MENGTMLRMQNVADAQCVWIRITRMKSIPAIAFQRRRWLLFGCKQVRCLFQRNDNTIGVEWFLDEDVFHRDIEPL